MDSEKITVPMADLLPVKTEPVIEPESSSSGAESQTLTDKKMPSPIKEVDEEDLYDHSEMGEDTEEDESEVDESDEVIKVEVKEGGGVTIETISEETEESDLK